MEDEVVPQSVLCLGCHNEDVVPFTVQPKSGYANTMQDNMMTMTFMAETTTVMMKLWKIIPVNRPRDRCSGS